MNDEKQKRRSGWYWWALLLPVIYVLSVGPVAKVYWRLIEAGYDWELPGTSIVAIYAPLEWACNNNGQVEQFFDWYIHELWQVYS